MKKLVSLVVLLCIAFSGFSSNDDDDEQSTLLGRWSPITLISKSNFKDYVEVKNLEIWEEHNTFDYNEYKYKFTYNDTNYGVKYVKSYDIIFEESPDDKCYVKVVTDIWNDNDIHFLIPSDFEIGRLTFGFERD